MHSDKSNVWWRGDNGIGAVLGKNPSRLQHDCPPVHKASSVKITVCLMSLVWRNSSGLYRVLTSTPLTTLSMNWSIDQFQAFLAFSPNFSTRFTDAKLTEWGQIPMDPLQKSFSRRLKAVIATKEEQSLMYFGLGYHTGVIVRCPHSFGHTLFHL